MLSIPKVKAACWAIGKRLQGYHLLQNPAGTPKTEVNMLKTWSGLSEFYDDMFQIERIKKSFDTRNTEEHRYLCSTHYFDTENMQLTKPRQKEIFYSVNIDDKFIRGGEKQDIPDEIAEKRAIPKLSYKRSAIFIHDSEYDKMLQLKQKAELNRGYYKRKYRLIDKIMWAGKPQIAIYPPENRPNFFKVLYKNLTNKE